jgi:hypothetical protein
MKYVIAPIAALAFSVPALAQHKHSHSDKGPSGGPMEDVAGVHAELIVAGKTLTLNILDEDNKPIATKGFSGSALIVGGGARETLTLAPSGESALKGDAKAAIAKGAAITVTLKTAAAKSGQAKFKAP